MRAFRSILWVLISSFSVAAGTDEDRLIKPLIDWLRLNGGSFNDKLEIRAAINTTRYAVFAKEKISSDEDLIVVPRDIVFTDGGDGIEGRQYGNLWCPTVRRLLKEMKLGEDSKFKPYMDYLNAQSYGQIPSGWSVAGQRLLLDVLGQTDDEDRNDLPPGNPVGWIDDWKEVCNGSDDASEKQAALLLLQRGWDDIMIPVFDLLSHRNGAWLNTKSNSEHSTEEPVTLSASRDILQGEEIYTTYNFCHDCGNRKELYGTPQILRDYGFVENYPQRWYLATDFYFDLDEVVDEEGELTGELEVMWLGDEPGIDVKVGQFRRLERLREFGDFELEHWNPAVPKHELETILEYHRALVVAIEHGLAHWGFDHFGRNCETTEDDHVCRIGSRYDDLAFRTDKTNYQFFTCDNSGYLSFSEYKEVHFVKSHYQPIKYTIDPTTGGACLSIGNTIQICETYRPQYHEMFVHHTARFLKEIKRVLWVGGGDSMLLHEILKYPTLELVVGLEIDQIVTRSTFLYFGAQPHFDNEKVQWWFGDASKSLLMLPESYFGSFDMVLVDLSETVTSLLVTDKLDIMQALSLLLKPEGILAKNEHYKEQMSNIFKYRLQAEFPYVPVVCSQAMNMGSNKLDFLYETLTDHELNSPNLYIQPLEAIADPYEHFQDYRHNETAQIMCKDNNLSSEDVVTSEQLASPGILLILEAENVKLDLTNVNVLTETLISSLESIGLSKVSTSFSNANSDDATTGILSVLLQEGYVVIRTWPSQMYCAIDLQLWSKFDRQEEAKRSLLQALGDGDIVSSSYRIVAGGMFGVDTWKEDASKRGPRVTNTCDADNKHDEEKVTSVVDREIANVIFEETIEMIPKEPKFVVAVICGETPENCGSLKVLSGTAAVSHVVPLLSCPALSEDSSSSESLLQKMMNCEKEVLRTVLAFSTLRKDIRAVVIDPDASYRFSRIAYKVLKAKSKLLFSEGELYAMAVLGSNDDNEAWRRNLVERFRRNAVGEYRPSFIAQVVFHDNNNDNDNSNLKDGSGSIEVALAYTQDGAFYAKFVEAKSKIEERTRLVSSVKDITGESVDYDPDWEALHFKPHHYDTTKSWEQYQSQHPVGYQTIFQLEPKTARSRLELSPSLLINAITQSLIRCGLSLLLDGGGSTTNPDHLVDSNQGDGCVLMVAFEGGNCVVLWDGRKHLDINFFTYAEDRDLAEEFQSRLQVRLPDGDELTVNLRDVQPRGYGGTINFVSEIGDLNERTRPIWAPKQNSG